MTKEVSPQYQPGMTVRATLDGLEAECRVVRRTQYTMWIDVEPFGLRAGNEACIDIGGKWGHLEGIGPYSGVHVLA